MKILSLLRCQYSFSAILLVFWIAFSFAGHVRAEGAGGQVKHKTIKELGLNDLRPVFLDAIKKYSPWADDEVEIKNLRMYPSKVKVEEGRRITFDPHIPSNGRYLGRVTIPVSIKADGSPLHQVQLTGKVEVYRKVFCARNNLPKGHILTRDDLILSKRPLSRLHGEAVSEEDIAALLGFELKRSLKGGQIIRKRDIRRPIIVKRGQLVTIYAKTPHIVVSLSGRAQDSGSLGDVIRVKNLLTKKVILAQIKDNRTVEVTF